MATTFTVRQKVSTVERSWQESVYSTTSERVATNVYNDYLKEFPDAYFELVKIETNETCIFFTPHKSK